MFLLISLTLSKILLSEVKNKRDSYHTNFTLVSEVMDFIRERGLSSKPFTPTVSLSVELSSFRGPGHPSRILRRVYVPKFEVRRSGRNLLTLEGRG